jgi:hypothetical protein
MELKQRRVYFNNCDPDASIEPDDPRFVDLDSFNDKDESVRGQFWVADLASDFRNSDKARCELFTGLPGSGKSTLLRSLARELEAPTTPGEPSFLTVRVKAEQWIDPAAPIEATDLHLAILYEAEKALIEREGGDTDLTAIDGNFTRLWNWINNTDVTLKGIDATFGAELSIPATGKLSASAKTALELRTDPTLRQAIRDLVKNRLHTFLVQVWNAHHDLYTRAKKLGFSGVVVIVDSLEKLRGIQSNFKEVLDSAETLFGNGAAHVWLANRERGADAALVHVLYTVPPALTLRTAMHELRFLPMIKLRAKDGAEHALGYRAALELIEKRVPRDALDEVFGADQREARCRAMIRWSGGYPRDIVRVLRACVKQTVVVRDALFDRIIADVSDAYRRIITVDAFPWLAEVAKHKDLSQRDEPAHRELVGRALSDNLVLRYMNGGDWFDVHPAIAEMPRFIEACAKLAEKPDATLGQR